MCDNKVTVAALQAGKAKEPFLRQIAREIWFLVSAWDIQYSVQYIKIEGNVGPDRLSRGIHSPVDNNNMLSFLSS